MITSRAVRRVRFASSKFANSGDIIVLTYFLVGSENSKQDCVGPPIP